MGNEYCMAMMHALVIFSLSPQLGIWGVSLELMGIGVVSWKRYGSYLSIIIITLCSSTLGTLVNEATNSSLYYVGCVSNCTVCKIYIYFNMYSVQVLQVLCQSS